MGRPATQLLSVGMIVSEAVKLIDAGEELTMRKLATRLDVSAPSIYYYVANKAHLINLIRDSLALADPPRFGPEDHWRVQVEAIVRAQRRAYSEHPRLVPMLVATPIAPGPVLETYGALAHALERGGFGAADIGIYLEVLDSFALGIGLEQAAPADVWAVESSTPALHAATVAWPDPAARLDAAFEFGLKVLLDAIQERAAS